MSIREWRTCRIYDPAIDFSPILDEHGNPQQRRNEDGELDTVARSDVSAYVEDRDEKHLTLLPGMQPVWFWLGPLTVRQMRDYVGRASTIDERNLRAFECAALRIENLDGAVVTIARKDGDIPMAKDGELDRLMALGLTIGDFWDIGSAAFVRATVPKGCGAALHVPRSSMLATVTRRARFLPAALNAQDSTKPSDLKAPPAETTTQPD